MKKQSVAWELIIKNASKPNVAWETIENEKKTHVLRGNLWKTSGKQKCCVICRWNLLKTRGKHWCLMNLWKTQWKRRCSIDFYTKRKENTCFAWEPIET